MAKQTALAMLACVLLQVSLVVAAAQAPKNAVRVSFSVTGLPAQQASGSAAIRAAVAKAARVPPTAVSAARPCRRFPSSDESVVVTEMAFTVTAVNLAAPYAALTRPGAQTTLATELRTTGALYMKGSLEVEAPQWVVETQMAASAVGGVTVDFTMTGVTLPSVNQFRLRAAIATVAGVRLEQVSIVSVAYAVDASGRRLRAADGYSTLRVVAAVDEEAAEAAGLLGSPTVARSLKQQLLLVLGATYREGSLRISDSEGEDEGSEAPAGADVDAALNSSSDGSNDVSGGGSNQALMLGLTIAAAVAAAAAILTTSVAAFRCYRARQAQALESDMPVDKEVDEEAAWSAAPLGAQDIAGAKAVPTTA
mmetsp:Transcript_20927/g.62981  ORF Transcript_20927/g.62981 Transcript_20927/m.62981 type:complete len:366 (+) Transcript_20927:154-1251(+)